MKLIISHSQTKRTIDGDFYICGDVDDLKKLAKKIRKKIRKDFSYGWIRIGKEVPILANTPPVDWDTGPMKETS